MITTIRLSRAARVGAVSAGAVLALVGTSGLVTVPAAAQAPTVPSDSSAQGYLGFCDAANHQVRSGRVDAAPFAWKTVSSVAAPSGYSKTTLVAFQPRTDVDPQDWSGKQLTGASRFSSTVHPMVEGTQLDPALVDFTGAYPVKDGGLVQVRMFFGAANRPAIITPYPAAFLMINGNRWTQVGGGRVDCAAGEASSTERLVLPKASFSPKQPRPVPLSAAVLAAAGRQDSGRSSDRSGGSAAAGDHRSGGHAAPAGSSNVADTSGRASGATAGRDSAPWWAIPLAALVALAGGAVVLRRRARRTT